MDTMKLSRAGISPAPERIVSPSQPTLLPEEVRSSSAREQAPSAEQVFRAYAPRVYNVARRMVNSHVDAEDVTQDVLLQVVRKLPSFRGEASLPTWLHRITINTALSHRRKMAVREGHRVHNDFEQMVENAASADWTGRSHPAPDQQVVEQETRRLLDEAIAELPPTYRSVFVLADIDGLPNAAIAKMLGLSLAAVKSRLHRARLLLRDALASHFSDAT
jgi:RNA polymerase sigma-70 factor (ECF subfamily)